MVAGMDIAFLSGSELELFFGINDPDSGDAFWNMAHTWTIASATNSLSMNGLDINNADYLQGTFSLATSPTQLQLKFTPVPELETFAMFALGGGIIALWFWRRRR